MRVVLLLLFCLLPTRLNAQRVVINEILPSPLDGGSEFIELLLFGETELATSSIEIRDLSGRWSTLVVNRSLLPVDTLLLMRSIPSEHAGGQRIGTLSPWPSLNNNGDSLFVRVNDLVTDRMGYNSSLSGVSWERISPDVPGHIASNWALSTNPSGMTPGIQNSVFFLDVAPPRVIGAEFTSDQWLTVWFSEPISDRRRVSLSIISENQTIAKYSAPIAGRRYSVNLAGLGVPTRVRVEGYEDYAGHPGPEAEVAVSIPPEPGDVFLAEVHFKPGGLGQAGALPEYLVLESSSSILLSMRDVSLSVQSEAMTFPGSPLLLVHPDSLVQLNKHEQVVFSTDSWPRESSFEASNDAWFSTHASDPFLALYARTPRLYYGGHRDFSLPNSGAQLRLSLGAQLLDLAPYHPSCFDLRFADHRGRSMIRHRGPGGISGPGGNDGPGGCEWGSSLFASGTALGFRINVPDLDVDLGLPKRDDLMITEIMFDPEELPRDGSPAQVEFIEMLNTSSQPIALHELTLIRQSGTSDSVSESFVSGSQVWLRPGQVALLFDYPDLFDDHALLESLSLDGPWPGTSGQSDVVFIPSRRPLGLSNQSGRIRILSPTGEEVASARWDVASHYEGLASTRGRSLHRAPYSGDGEIAAWMFGAWTTSSNPGGATPGIVNSIGPDHTSRRVFSVHPLSFYPDRLDLAHEVSLSVPGGGAQDVVRVEVFDREGHRIRTLSGGRFLDGGWTSSWDGRNQERGMCPTGVYILVATIFDERGRIRDRIKKPVALFRGTR